MLKDYVYDDAYMERKPSSGKKGTALKCCSKQSETTFIAT